MISNKLIAIDFGSTRISAMAAEVLENGAVKIYSDESKISEDVKCGIVEKPTGASFKVTELLKLIRNSANLKNIGAISVSVGAKSMKQVQVTVSRFVNSPNIVTEELLAGMLEEAETKMAKPDLTVFEVFPVSYMVDGIRKDEPVGKKAIQIIANYNVICGNAIIKSEIIRCFDRTGGVIIEYTPLAVEALSTVLLEENEKEVGCALINFGATTTTLATYHDGILQNLVVVPLGAKNITKDIQELGINESNAERLKCLKGLALESLVEEPIYIQVAAVEAGQPPVKISTKFLATIIEARLEEILQPIFDVIRDLSFELEAGIVIAGGGAKLTNIIEFIAEKAGIHARFGDHSEWLADGTPEKYHDPVYAQQIGTILLTHEYRTEHPLEETVMIPTNIPKIPKRDLGSKLGTLFMGYFNEENNFADKKLKKI